MPVITLLTDFGLKDGNVGVMKGVIWSIAPDAHIADLSHTIHPQDISEAALVLARAAPYFPDGTVHMVVVDPGVGTARRPIAARLGEYYFVGPDNGVITMLLHRIEGENKRVQFVHLNQAHYWLPEVSNVFHGRDIFAPCTAHLAAGVPLEDLGDPLKNVFRLDFPQPERFEFGYRAQVIHLDHFGNISTNVRLEHLKGHKVGSVHLNGFNIPGLVRTFGDRSPGDLVALFGSTGNLIISIVNGNAAQHLNASVGHVVDIRLER